MKNLRDIKVKLGDKVYFESRNTVVVNVWAEMFPNYSKIEEAQGKITKIERPVKYETIYETPKQILDKEEKEYLENVLRPFRYRVEGIIKHDVCSNNTEFIYIKIRKDDNIMFPNFDKGSMYKGMKLNKEYTIKELGLFEGENK